METDVRNMAIIAAVIGALAGVAEFLHPGAGWYSAGLGMGVWLSAGWIDLRTSE